MVATMITKMRMRLIAERLSMGIEPSEIAAALGVGLGYILHLQKNADFQALLGELESESASPEPEPEELASRVLNAAPAAISVMIELMMDTRQSGSVRQKAAEWVLAREASIAAMEVNKGEGPTVQQILFDHRASMALARLVQENDNGQSWLARVEERLNEMPPTVE